MNKLLKETDKEVGPHRVPAKWRERRAMRVTVRARPRTASERCCQKPCTSGVNHRSLPNAVRSCLNANEFQLVKTSSDALVSLERS